MSTGVLANRKVLELGSMIAAPFATHILSQLGAEITKIEPPSGETTRSLVRGGPSGTYIAYNRGKKSLCLDLRSEAGKEVFRKLVAEVDIIVHNLSPGAARRLGIEYEDCAAINPDVVYCHIKGYGPGPLEEEVASNPIAEAATGVMYSNRVDGRPSRLGPSYHDQFAGCYAVIGILSALMGPAGPGEHRNISFGLYETGLHIAARDLVAVQLKSHLTGRPEVEPSPEFSIPGYGAYETRDGRWIYLVMLSDEHWRRFCEAVSLEADPDLASLRHRRKARERVEQLVADAVAGFDYDDLAAKLSEKAIGHTEVLSMDRVLDMPQARVGGKSATFAFGSYSFESPNLPIAPPPDEADASTSPPLLGEDSKALLSTLGYSPEAIKSLLGSGAVVQSKDESALWAESSPARTTT